MDAALAYLLFLRMRGGIRHRLKQLASLRGVLFLLAVGGVIWLLLVASTSPPGAALLEARLTDPQAMREYIRNFLPLGLLLTTLFTVLISTGRAFYFSPSETNFLFAGPFGRRDLIVYKFCAYLAGAALSAAIITPFLMEGTGAALGGFAGSLLTIVFVQLSSAAIGMAGQAFEAGWLRRVRWPVLVLALAVTGAAMLNASAMPEGGIFVLLSGFRESWIGTVVLAPYTVFAELFLAQRLFPDLIGWSAVAIVINAALLRTIIGLEGRASDRALSENSRRSNRWNRIRRGGSYWASERTAFRSIRHAPMVGGLGPLVWRQIINAARNSGKVIIVFLAVAAGTGPIVSAAGVSFTDTRVLATIYFFIAFIVPRTLVCDFRGDLSRMETYKTLPIAPWRICLGQIIVPVTISSAIGLTMIASALLFLDDAGARIAKAMMAFTLPFSLLLYAMENTIYLLFPAKLVPIGRADFEFLGRTMVEFVIKSFVIIAALAVGFGAGLITLRASGHSWILSGLVSWLTLALIGAITVLLLAYAFRRFAVAETIE